MNAYETSVYEDNWPTKPKTKKMDQFKKELFSSQLSLR